MAIHIGRRQFIVTLGGAAVACPLAASAQQAGKVWRIGFLSAVSRESGSRSYAALQQGMRELGYVEGKEESPNWRSTTVCRRCSRCGNMRRRVV
jgi:putative tryptophan/tyrosine transport system substrate-binding protein